MNRIIFFSLIALVNWPGRTQEVKKGPGELRTFTIGNLASAPRLTLKIKNIIMLETPPEPRAGKVSPSLPSTGTVPYIENSYRVMGFNSGYILLDKHENGEDLYAYNTEGKFLWKAIRGKGPGEFNRINQIAVSPLGNRIAIMDAKSVSEYRPDGGLIRKTRAPLRSISHFNYLTETEAIIQAPNYQNYPFLLYRWKDSSAVPVGIRRKINERAIDVGDETIQPEQDGSAFYTHYLTDTIYRVTATGLSPAFVLDFGRHGINSLTPRELWSAMEPANLLRDKKTPHIIGRYHFGHGMIYFIATDGKNGYHCRINAESGQLTTLPYGSSGIFGINLHGGLIGYNMDDMIWGGRPEEIGDLARSGALDKIIGDPLLLERLKKLTENDNPVLIIAE